MSKQGKKTRSTAEKLPLMKRFRLNRDKQLRRLEELDKEIEAALDRGEVPKLADQDTKMIALRREFEDLEREFDQRNMRRLAAQSVAIYGGPEGKTVTSVAAVAGVRTKKTKAKAKSKTKAKMRRIRF